MTRPPRHRWESMAEMREATLEDLQDPNVLLYDHLPDGTILEPMPFDDARALYALLRKRMTPEAFDEMVVAVMELTQANQR